jgi:hypothetical protein
LKELRQEGNYPKKKSLRRHLPLSSKECWTEVKSKGRRRVDKIQEKKQLRDTTRTMQIRSQRKRANVLRNDMKKRKALDGREKIPELVINHTNDNLIIKIDDDDIDSDKNTTKQHKKLKRTNEGYLDDHENMEDNMFDALFFNNEDISS